MPFLEGINRGESFMLEFLWWAFITAIGISIGVFGAGFRGALFMALVGLLGGGFMLFERKNHP